MLTFILWMSPWLDLNTIEKYFDHIVILNKKVIAQGPVSEAFTKENVDKAFVR